MRFPAPDPAHGGERLAQAIEDATGHPASVSLVGDEWEVVTEAASADVQPIVDTHDSTPVQPDPSVQDRIAEVERRLDAAPSTADLDELRQTLGGN